jgi:Acetyltransferase (GNAT) domain
MFLKSKVIRTLDFHIYDSLAALENDLLPHRTLFLEKDYLLSMEESSPSALSFRYLCLKEKGRLVAAFYFQVINLSSSQLGQIINFEPYSKILSGLSMLVQNMLFGAKKDKPHYLVICGNMYLSGDYGILCEEKDHQKAANYLLDGFDFVRKELEKTGKVMAKIAKDYPAENDFYGPALKEKKFYPLVMDPIMEMAIRPHWNNFEDYISDLSSKYRQRYQQVKKKLATCEVRVMKTDELIERKEEIDRLYLAVQMKSPVRLIMHDSDYLISLSKRLKSKIEFKGIFENGKLLAFMAGIRDHNHFEAHHIGIDYEYNKSHNLYQNLLYEYIEMAILAKSPLLSFGRTALEMKTTVGAVAHTYHAYIKLNNGLINGIAGHMLPKEYEMDWIPRNPFKQ